MDTHPTFEQFWRLYPRKDSKKAALKAWERLTDVNKFNAWQGLQNLVQHSKQYQSREFAPHASTFLNGERWNDEVDGPTKQEKIVLDQDKSKAHAVWSAMLQIFGQSWINRYGEQPNELWSKVIEKYDRETLMRALVYCIDTPLEYPPTLNQFKLWCRTHMSNRALMGDPSQQRLPRPPKDEQLALESLAEMKRILGVRDGTTGDTGIERSEGSTTDSGVETGDRSIEAGQQSAEK